ncbi:M23 family metallopeptidase [Methylobacterium sp. MA0201]|uniref:M23 family metallopeptidase n=1 Tax=Methylobacterium alsaeris TaxID=3344826 RepID=UPI0037577E3C
MDHKPGQDQPDAAQAPGVEQEGGGAHARPRQVLAAPLPVGAGPALQRVGLLLHVQHQPFGLMSGDAGTAALGQPGENGQVDPLGGAGRLGSPFGMRRHPLRGDVRMHWGQDMPAPAGSGVSAMQGGRITAINRSGDVTVTHADGSTKTYRHIAPGEIGVGQEVKAGDRIGSLRAHDRRSTGPHLHVEATDARGRRYDPRAEIEAARRPRQEGRGGSQSSGAGDELMRHFHHDAPPRAAAGASASASGKLDIHLHGFPAGTRAQASMGDLFRETNVTRGRSQMNLDRA